MLVREVDNRRGLKNLHIERLVPELERAVAAGVRAVDPDYEILGEPAVSLDGRRRPSGGAASAADNHVFTLRKGRRLVGPAARRLRSRLARRFWRAGCVRLLAERGRLPAQPL